MIRMIILEMEETLVEVRASAARSIADGKEMRRAWKRLDELQASWTEKAELALSKDREDLAKAALIERQKAADMADGLKAEIAVIDDTLKGYEADIAKLQAKLREARARQNAIAARFDSAVTRAKAREIMHGSRTEDAFCALRTARAPRRLRRRPRRRARHRPKPRGRDRRAARRRRASRRRTGSHESRRAPPGRASSVEKGEGQWPARIIATRSIARTPNWSGSARRSASGSASTRPSSASASSPRCS